MSFGQRSNGGIAPALRGGAMAVAVCARRTLRLARGLPAVALLGAWLAACDEPIDVVVERIPAVGDAAPVTPMDAASEDAAGDAAPIVDAAADTGIDMDADTGMPVEPPCPYRSAPPPSGVASSVAEQVAAGLGRALCTCDGYSGSGALTVDVPAGTASGDVGIDVALDLQLSSGIAGSLVVAGSDGISLGPAVALAVGADLSVGGPLEGAEASVGVVGDAEVAGRIDLTDLEVGGVLTQTPGEPLLVANAPTIGEMRSELVQVAPVCGCDPASLLDVGALVNARAPAAEPLPDGPLPATRCAEYALDGGTVDALSLAVSSSVAIYVSGDLALQSLAVDVAAGAELDLFLEGNLRVDTAIELASQAGGGAVRFHIGGNGTTNLLGGELRGALYAPNAELVLTGPLTITGALLARRVAAADAVVVHHDTQASTP